MADLLPPSTARVLELLASGLSTGEAADHLGVARTAARDELLRAMKVLGASSKLEAVILAMREGLIERPPPRR